MISDAGHEAGEVALPSHDPDRGAAVSAAANGATYDRRTIILHWVVAAIIPFMWLLAQFAHQLPKGPFRLGVWSVHVIVGLSLAVIVVARLSWRATRGRRLPRFNSGPAGIAATAVQATLYLLLATVVVFGLSSVSAFPVFGLWTFPVFWTQPTTHEIREWHGLAANILMGLASLHALAALYHHHVLRDGLMRRMGISSGATS